MFKLLKFVSGSARGAAAKQRLMDLPADSESNDPVERLMRKIDYYLHCELDAEYQHADSHEAREALIEALRQEFDARGARDLAPAVRQSAAPNDPLCA